MTRSRSIIALVLSFTAPALAQDDVAERARRALLDAAEAARRRGDHASAIELGTRASLVRMTPSLRLLLAQEHEAVGDVVEAFEGAVRCAREAEDDPGLRNRGAVLEACRTLRDRAAAQVGRIVVRVDDAAAGTRVVVGDRELPAPLWGVAIPRAPGAVSVVATAAGHVRFERRVEITRGTEVRVDVSLPVVVEQRPPPDAPPSPRVVPALARRANVVGPSIIAGLGAASLGAAGVLWALRGSALSARDGTCDAGGCDPGAVTHNDRARDLTLATNLAIGVGAATLAGAALWFVLALRRSSEPAPLRSAGWSVAIHPGGGGLVVGGAL